MLSLFSENSFVKGRRGVVCVKKDIVIADDYEDKLKMSKAHPFLCATDLALEKISTCPPFQRAP